MLIIYKISKKEKKMKICTFMIASTNFMMFFALRSAYFYVKPCLKDLYHLTDLFLSLMDVSLFLGIAAGHLLRFCFTNPRNIIKPFQISIIFLFSCITLLSFAPQMQAHISSFKCPKILILLVIYLLGVPTSCFQSFLFEKVKQSYKGKNLQMLYGCLSGCGHLGKAIGFVVMPIFIVDFHLFWSSALMLLNLLLLGANLLVYFYFRNSKKEIEQYKQRQILGGQQIQKTKDDVQSIQISHKEFFEFIPVVLSKRKTFFYLLLIGCSKALSENVLIWLPVYLFSHNYQKLSSASAFIYILPIIFGSFIIGYIYQRQTNKAKNKKSSITFLFTTAIITIIGFFILTSIQLNHLYFMIIVSTLGMMMGGFCNILLENVNVAEIFAQRQIEMFTTVIKIFTHVGLGLLDLAIGVIMQIRVRTNGKNMHNYDAIFQILLITSIVCLGLLTYWYSMIRSNLEKQESVEVGSV